MSADLASMRLVEAARVVCFENGVTFETMTEKSIGGALMRGGHNCLAPIRGRVWHTLRSVQNGAGPKWSYPEIARVFGTKHSTVMTAIRRHEASLVAATV